MDGLWATKSEGVELIVRAVSFQDFQPMWSWSTNVTDGRTDRQTDGRHAIAIPRFALTSAPRGKHYAYGTSYQGRIQAWADRAAAPSPLTKSRGWS